MPLYPYYCETCGKSEEIIRSIHDNIPETLICSDCGDNCARDYSRQECNFVLNGVGWARDGYSHDIDDMEDLWLKEGKKTGYWAGTNRGYKTDSKGRIDKSALPERNIKKEVKCYTSDGTASWG